jgi:Holliday junction resolvase RusA-like endonuclease
MKTTFKIEIPGNPIAKKRPRFYRRGNRVGAYNSQQSEEGKILALLHDQIQVIPMIVGPIEVDLCFYILRPKSHFGTGKNAGVLKTKAPIFHTKKSDLDNLIKFPLDILNQQVWKDDAQIFKIIASKHYTLNKPRTIIIINEITE